jgi:hypothetical protein
MLSNRTLVSVGGMLKHLFDSVENGRRLSGRSPYFLHLSTPIAYCCKETTFGNQDVAVAIRSTFLASDAAFPSSLMWLDCERFKGSPVSNLP